jgi:hypothetical protein
MHFVRKRVQHSFHFYGAKFILRICWYVAYTNGCRILPFAMFGAASFLSVGHLTRRPRTSSHKYFFPHPARTPATSLFDATPDTFILPQQCFALYQQFSFFAVMERFPSFHACMECGSKVARMAEAQIMANFTARFVAIIFVPFQKPSHATKHAPAVSGNNVTTSGPCGNT